MTERLAHPAIQTRLAAIGNAFVALLLMFELITLNQAAALNVLYAAIAGFLSAWYDPTITAVGPSGTDSPRWLDQ